MVCDGVWCMMVYEGHYCQEYSEHVPQYFPGKTPGNVLELGVHSHAHQLTHPNCVLDDLLALILFYLSCPTLGQIHIR